MLLNILSAAGILHQWRQPWMGRTGYALHGVVGNPFHFLYSFPSFGYGFYCIFQLSFRSPNAF
jgi:hypothetical protein